MRTLGLVFLFLGSLVLITPTLAGLVHRHYRFDDGPMLGSALLCLGVAALILARGQISR